MEKEKFWMQTWANYYSHIIAGKSAKETHDILKQERKTHTEALRRSQEHLDGIVLFYEQSAFADPDPPGEKEKGSVSHSNDPEPTVSEHDISHKREISDREI